MFKYATISLTLIFLTSCTSQTINNPSATNTQVSTSSPYSTFSQSPNITPSVPSLPKKPISSSPQTQTPSQSPHTITSATPRTSASITPTPTPMPNQSTDQIRTDYSEGICNYDTECTWAGQGCGGGHGICTNNPKKYKDLMTTCEINDNFPANQGFSCGCIEATSKCGWKM